MKKLTLDYAHQLIALSIKKANSDYGRPISISICDDHGELIAFSRMEGAPPRSINISQRKAYTAVRAGCSTNDILERLHRDKLELSFYCDALFTGFPGGNLLKDKDNNIIGSIGISGLVAFEDHAITVFIAELVSAE